MVPLREKKPKKKNINQFKKKERKTLLDSPGNALLSKERKTKKMDQYRIKYKLSPKAKNDGCVSDSFLFFSFP